MENGLEEEALCGWPSCADGLDDIWLHSLCDGPDGLVLKLRQLTAASPIVVVTFESAIAVRTCGESYRLRLPAFPRGGHLIFVVTNSAFIEWIVSESSGAWDSSGWTHFMVVTQDSYVDVVSKRPPVIESVLSGG